MGPYEFSPHVKKIQRNVIMEHMLYDRTGIWK